jgi:hypothetical protein
MCRFANECMQRMNFLSRRLEVHLGPDTAELELRAGLHSGAVTAGVLRGVRSRFQLFGDTMNTASRMESTGQRGKIQVSQDTADLLVAAGKTAWISAREERVVAKGKGEMQTYWVNILTTIDISGFQDGMGSIGGSLSEEDGPFATLSPKTTRLVLWNVEILLDLLRQVKVQRGEGGPRMRESVVRSRESTQTAYTEVQDAIQFGPPYKGPLLETATDGVELGDEVEHQLEDFISTIASMYIDDNGFHDFAHASHATMGVVKLLSSLVKSKEGSVKKDNPSHLIASNPLVQFAIVLSTIIHDVDHPGVPNSVLTSEKTRMASVYGFKSVAEQNSLDLAWDLLMDDTYADLRAAIYRTQEDKNVFRQVLVNCVMATDLFDKGLKDRSDSRWKLAFPSKKGVQEQASLRNLQATLVIETIIQAADVAHTMQHWQVYRKWNVRLFEELYQGFVNGRILKDPSVGWYEEELGFYDHYVLPLVHRLQKTGAFVAASTDSHLDYAEQNRQQWEERGKDILAEMIDATRAKVVARSGSDGGSP